MKVTSLRSEPAKRIVTSLWSEPKGELIMTKCTYTEEGPIPHYKLYQNQRLVLELPVKIVKGSKRGVRPVRVNGRLIYILPGGVDFDPAVDWLK